jgi:hypothetical protein
MNAKHNSRNITCFRVTRLIHFICHKRLLLAFIVAYGFRGMLEYYRGGGNAWHRGEMPANVTLGICRKVAISALVCAVF